MIKHIGLFTAVALISAPALADHVGPSGVGAGGGLSIFGPDTLDGGHWAAGLRVVYTRPEQRSDAELAALLGDVARDVVARRLTLERDTP